MGLPYVVHSIDSRELWQVWFSNITPILAVDYGNSVRFRYLYLKDILAVHKI